MEPNINDLKDLHKCANDLLLCPMIQHDHNYNSCNLQLQHMSETILKMLDLCGTAREVLLSAKEQLQDLHSAARRAVVLDQDSSDFEAQISAHNLRRKKLKKETARCLRSLKEMNKCDKYLFTSDLSLIDSNLIVVVHVLREVRAVTVCMVESLLSVISTPASATSVSNQSPRAHNQRWRSAPSKGSSFHFWRQAARISQRLSDKSESVAGARTEIILLAAGEVKPVQDLQVELECIIRSLIHTRVLLLNILNN